MNWPTGESGTYQIKMQLGNAARTVLLETGPITLKVDNTGPHVEFNSLAWRVAGTPTWHAVDINHCIIVDRPTGATLEFKVDYTGSARHLLKVQLRPMAAATVIWRPSWRLIGQNRSAPSIPINTGTSMRWTTT